jgi:hypothetical protein
MDPESGMEKLGSGSATLLVENNFVGAYLKTKSKAILTPRSEVFAAMLRHEFLEKQNSRVDIKVSVKARLSLQKDKFAERFIMLSEYPEQTLLFFIKYKIRYLDFT